MVLQVWEELKEHARAGTPVLGRVLNEVNGGHAVGIAGFVGFAPYSQILRSTANLVGQPFLGLCSLYSGTAG